MTQRHWPAPALAPVAALVGALLAAFPRAAAAQFIGGRVVSAGARLPLADVPVVLYRAADDTTGDAGTRPAAPALDSARTDTAGVFYVSAPDTGAFRVRLGPAARGGAVVPATAVIRLGAPGDVVEREFVLGFRPAPDPTKPFFEFQVEKPAELVGRFRAPPYPPELRKAKVEGDVIVQFVVDTLGQVEPPSVRILESTHPAFDTVVGRALLAAQFRPAELAGRPVRQVVQLPFQFRLGLPRWPVSR